MSDTSFSRCTYDDRAHFGRVTFQGETHFDGSRFGGDTRFDGAAFGGRAWFGGATFAGYARFAGATFAHYARFADTSFQRASFARAAFRADVSFTDARFRDAWFRGATFEAARQVGPMRVDGSLGLDEVICRERAEVEVDAADISCRRARFLTGVHLRVGRAELVMDDADIAAPSILSSATAFSGREGNDSTQPCREARSISDDGPRPRLLSLQRTDVAGLTLAGVDLRACRFMGAHHLDQLRIDECELGTAPPAWWRTPRQTIAEEHSWRTERVPTAGQVAAIYRDLRKGREDSKDEPGAADFYYGEMEMRRQATRRRHRPDRRRSATAFGEHVILTLYWLLSGYGLRAWRAMSALAILVMVGGLVFARWGLATPVDAGDEPPPSGLDELSTGIRTSAHAATALLRGTDAALTPTGEWLHLGLRLVGPVLLGLAVLSIRGRVKR